MFSPPNPCKLAPGELVGVLADELVEPELVAVFINVQAIAGMAQATIRNKI